VLIRPCRRAVHHVAGCRWRYPSSTTRLGPNFLYLNQGGRLRAPRAAAARTDWPCRSLLCETIRLAMSSRKCCPSSATTTPTPLERALAILATHSSGARARHDSCWAVAQVSRLRGRAGADCCFQRWCVQPDGSQLAISLVPALATARPLVAMDGTCFGMSPVRCAWLRCARPAAVGAVVEPRAQPRATYDPSPHLRARDRDEAADISRRVDGLEPPHHRPAPAAVMTSTISASGAPGWGYLARDASISRGTNADSAAEERSFVLCSGTV
jgi:hypothetical protein